MVASKQSNGGIAQDSGSVVFYKNGSPEDTQNFNLGDNLSSVSYEMTSVSPGDTLAILISEG